MRAVKSRPAGATDRLSTNKVLEDLNTQYRTGAVLPVRQHAVSGVT